MKFLVTPLPEDILYFEGIGEFSNAIKLVGNYLKKDLPLLLKDRLTYEKERIKRIKIQYPFTENTAKRKLFKNIDGFSDKEYRKFLKTRDLDFIVINGVKKFEQKFLDNLVFKNPELKERYKIKNKKREKARELIVERIKALSNGQKPKTYKVTAKLKVKPDIKKIPGNKIRCWLPFPQKDVKLIETSHKKYFISPENSTQRTIYFEDTKHRDIEFSVKFQYKINETKSDIDIMRVKKFYIPEYLKEELPHIVFTPYLRELTRSVVGDEDNPYLRAKRIFDWITLNIKYSYVHSYSLYDNIPMFAATNLTGDCGVQALLFVTMCRIAGVPAKWQSGWYINPYFGGPHDWAMFYVTPYGWLPVDASFGGSRRENPEQRAFYFGNLDGFRMIANSEAMADFTPKKRYYRTDPYDNQVGELETEKENIYSDAYNYNIKVISFEEV